MRFCEVCSSTFRVQRHKKTGQLLCNKHRLQLKRHGRILEKTNRDPNDFIIEGNIAKIVLFNKDCTKSGEAIIDVDDLDSVKKHKWYLTGSGYVMTRIDKNRQLFLHHLIIGRKPGLVVDHIDRNPLNNRKLNLRHVTQHINCTNTKLSKNNTSGYTGVTWSNKGKKWVAQIMVNSKMINLGRFNDIDGAIRRRKIAESKYFKDLRPN